MFSKGLDFIKNLIAEDSENKEGSVGITDKEIIKKYVDDENFPFLVSFPRTGSHWLRMMMELYFEKPSLVRSFYFHDKDEYTVVHAHDVDLDLERKNIIYLYRNPVDTVFSQMMYDKENLKNKEKVEYWSNTYKNHLRKWLLEESFTKNKTIVRYENLLNDLHKEFEKVTKFFGDDIDSDKLDGILQKVSKKELKKKTTHDKQVVNLSDSYSDKRSLFKEDFEEYINEIIFKDNSELSKFFED